VGKIKDQMIREEDAIAAAVSRRVRRVSAGGGDAMAGGMMGVLAALEKEAADKGLTLEQLALAEEAEIAKAEEEVSAALAQADASDKELDRMNAANVSTLPAPPSNPPVEEPAAEPEPALTFEMPPQDYMRKGQHYQLVFQGVCSHCAHCAMQLTDAVSIERGLGPVCSKRGYLEDPTDPDEMQAMIDLAEYPQLVEYLVAKYKPQGVRGLMNGLVKICSLNRRSPVHPACCDAIESLGYKNLASTLRESLAVLEIKEHDDKTYHLWVKRSEWSIAWQYDLRRVSGAYMSRQYKGWLVPKTQKQLLWAYMLKHFEGLCATVRGTDGSKKTVKITKKILPPASQPVT
jgi:Family of unknown function (DUF6011)